MYQTIPNWLAPTPISAIPFVGREIEIAELTDLLAQPACRLLTLLGIGGMGKTRLALEVASRLCQHDPTTIHFISFVTANTASDSFVLLAEAFKLSTYKGLTARQQVLSFLHDKYLLLVLDNLEGLLDNLGWISELLSYLPQLKILATSREALNLREEWLYPLWGLDFPASATLTSSSLQDFDAIQLFAQCACRADKDFELERDYEHIVHICQMVGGLPLAIELAAGWLKALSCKEVAEELAKHSIVADPLQSSVRNLPDRHRSISMVLAHTWNSLLADERDCLTQLSIFRGTFSWEAAEVIAHAKLPILASLIDKALLRKSTRYSLHELVHQYATQQLDDSERLAAQNRHSDYYLNFLIHQESALKGAAQIAAMDALDAELDNIRMAWAWATEQRHTNKLAEAAESLTLFCIMRGRAVVGESLLSRAVETLSPENQVGASAAWRKIRAYWLFILEWYELYHDSPSINEQMQQSLRDAHEYGDPVEIAFALKNCGHFAIHQSDYSAALVAFEESLALYSGLEDEYAMAQVLRLIGHCYVFSMRSEAGQIWYERSRELAVRSGDQVTLAVALMGLGSVASNLGQMAKATHYFEQAYEIQRKLSNWTRLAYTAYSLACLALEQHELSSAIAYATEALKIAKDTGYTAHEERAQFLLQEIEAASTEPMVAATLLTERELDVLRLMAGGLQNREIAERLVVVVGTVKAHVHSIYQKLDVTNRVQAVSRARQLNLLQQ